MPRMYYILDGVLQKIITLTTGSFSMLSARWAVSLFKCTGIAVLAFNLLLSTGEATPKKGKPQSPLQISIAPIDPSITPERIKPADMVEFVVTVVSLSDAEEIRILVELPKGSELVSGELSWSGSVSRNEKQTLKYTVKVPVKQSGPIKARVVMPSSEGHSFSASAYYALGAQAQPKDKSGTVRPLKKDSKGSDVIEYR